MISKLVAFLAESAGIDCPFTKSEGVYLGRSEMYAQQISSHNLLEGFGIYLLIHKPSFVSNKDCVLPHYDKEGYMLPNWDWLLAV